MTRNSNSKNRRRRGITITITAVMMVFTIPIVGLAIDAGVLYLIRARLSAACDAASLATARNLNMGVTLEEQEANARLRGEAFFYANFPSGLLGTSGVTPTIDFDQQTGRVLVRTSASGSAPVYFMKFMGESATLAGASGRASRRDVNLMLVLDRSGSMSGTPCSDMKAAAKTFVNMFVEGRDRIGIVSYNTSAYLAAAPAKTFKSTLNTVIDNIACGGWTNTPESYWQAYQQLVSIDEPLPLNLVVFFTDGMPTAFSANFPIKTQQDTRYGASGITGCSYTNTQCTVPKTTCNDDAGRTYTDPFWGDPAAHDGIPYIAPKLAVLFGGDSTSTGNNYGLGLPVATYQSTGDILIPSSQRTNCAVNTNTRLARRDIAYIPAIDNHGLSTAGFRTVTRFTSGPYDGQIRPDTPRNVQNVGFNLADNAATVIRQNTSLNVMTFTIGLDGNGGIDEELLRRMANDPSSTNYDVTKPPGLYVYAPNSAALNSAFVRVASEALRLAN